MFGFGKKRDPEENARLRTEKEKLEKDVRDLKDEVATLKHDRKIADEDIKHMVRIEKERMEVENERKQLERDREKEKAIADVKDEYRDKMEERLQTEVENIKSMYSEILKRLPTVTVRQHDSRHVDATE